MTDYNQRLKGFTLIEMLLVMVIISAIILAVIGYGEQKTDALRRDRATLQMQQILNAGLAYYINSSNWPTNLAALQSAGYLPTGTIASPWGTSYTIGTKTTSGVFAACAQISAGSKLTASTAALLAGRLPMAYTATSGCTSTSIPNAAACASSATSCYVVAMVNIPGQNLNNARSVNFGSIYHSGACVPVPTCPTGMTPEIFVVPTSVRGVFDGPSASDCPNFNTPCNNMSVYPISSYSAFAIGPVTNDSSGNVTIQDCFGNSSHTCYKGLNGGNGAPTGYITNGTYWRVCLAVVTEKGQVNPTPVYSSADPYGQPWGMAMGDVLAVTRCAPTNESTGSDMTVFSP